MALFVRVIDDDFAVANTVFERGEGERDSSFGKDGLEGGS